MVRTFGLLIVARLGLRVAGLRQIRTWYEPALAPHGPSTRTGIDPAVYACRCMSLVQRVSSQSALRFTCLHRAMVLCRLLRTSGLDARLVIGVNKVAHDLMAHAWVQLDRQALDPTASGYVPIGGLMTDDS